jgi:hypothetical protein
MSTKSIHQKRGFDQFVDHSIVANQFHYDLIDAMKTNLRPRLLSQAKNSLRQFVRQLVRSQLVSLGLFAVAAMLLASGNEAHAYPSFIGYSYTTCITCHYNSTGNGPLTDYGRALFSQEIAARPFIPSRISDDDLSQLSQFIPGVEIPRVRPHLKYRGLWVNQSTRSPGEKNVFYQMQRDVGATILLSSNQRTIFTATYGLLPRSQDYYGKGEMTEAVSREHYLRFYATKQLLVQVGLFDKVYGIKHEDHTAVNRGVIKLNQDSQSHGVMLQYFGESWDLAAHVFAGNLLEVETRRQKGGSLMGEYELFEKNRLGASFLTSSSDTVSRMQFAVHDRWGLPKAQGSAIMVEAGVFQEKDKAATEPPDLRNYIWIQGLVNLSRGVNILSTVERTQAATKFTSPETQKWSLGFLLFPFQRLETRFGMVQSKTFSPEGASDDQWALQGQVHVSL